MVSLLNEDDINAKKRKGADNPDIGGCPSASAGVANAVPPNNTRHNFQDTTIRPQLRTPRAAEKHRKQVRDLIREVYAKSLFGDIPFSDAKVDGDIHLEVEAPAGPRDALTESHDLCPEAWSEYAIVVRPKLKTGPEQRSLVLFVGTDGESHDCLGKNIDREIIRVVQKNETSLLPVSIEGALKERLLNVCTSSNARLDTLTYLKISLQCHVSVLRDSACEDQVLGGVDFELERIDGSIPS
ncbi:hypothetical protein [uncultured Roseobacter sp.]|uniref:hypothetical protein n=1 Tax=uncultured Roseobacter sp. TaxID=114847 RepID=UPI0026062D6D|nr:hypothetical protein [uncultured Roseobacter sp.]